MDPIQTAKVLDEQGLQFLSFAELKGVGLHGLMTEVQRLGINDSDLLTAPPVAMAGFLMTAQLYDPDVVVNLEQYLQKLRVRAADRSVLDGAAATPTKPREKSAVFGAVAVVHKTCDEMKGQDRKAVMARLVELGVNKNTAATQYAKWRAKPGNAGK